MAVGIAVVVTATGLLVAPSAQATVTASPLPAACRKVETIGGTSAVQDLCRALVAGDVDAIIALCHLCAGPNLTAQAAKWRDAAYRKAMLRALLAGSLGADMIYYPSFASGFYVTGTGYDLSTYPKSHQRRARRYVHVHFPRKIRPGWMPSYQGPVLAFGYTGVGYAGDPDHDSYTFGGTYDFGATTTDGQLCDWPDRSGCA